MAAFMLLAGAMSGAPAAEKVRGLGIIRTVEPHYPEVLINRGVYDGETRVIILVDSSGHLVDWLLRSYTHPLLAREATDALKQWQFEPALVDGQPVGVRTELIFSFHAGGMVTAVSSADVTDRVQLRGENREVHRVSLANELDEPLTVLKAVTPLPLPPSEARRRGGRAVVDFYIDEEGRTRLPVIKQADDNAFADATIEAISHWRFVVPTRNGIPVITHAAQAFKFDPIADQ